MYEFFYQLLLDRFVFLKHSFVRVLLFCQKSLFMAFKKYIILILICELYYFLEVFFFHLKLLV